MSDNIKKIIDNLDLRKIDDSYIVNTNGSQYEAALKRKRRREELEKRLCAIENNIEKIFIILQGDK